MLIQVVIVIALLAVLLACLIAMRHAGMLDRFQRLMGHPPEPTGLTLEARNVSRKRTRIFSAIQFGTILGHLLLAAWLTPHIGAVGTALVVIGLSIPTVKFLVRLASRPVSCPVCGMPAELEFGERDARTSEEFLVCPHCGLNERTGEVSEPD